MKEGAITSVVAIHQPNFLPWLGYFGKIARADHFVFLDDVQVPRTSRGSWCNRVRMLAGGEPGWLTVPVRARTAKGPIHALRMDEGVDGAVRIRNLLGSHYAKAPFARETWEWLEPLLARPMGELAVWNMEVIADLAERLGLRAEFRRSSAIPLESQPTGSARLAMLTLAVGGGVYLSGDGAQGYEEPEEYRSRGIVLQANGFVCEPYPQMSVPIFIPGLSVIDALFNIGFAATTALLERHRERF